MDQELAGDPNLGIRDSYTYLQADAAVLHCIPRISAGDPADGT